VHPPLTSRQHGRTPLPSEPRQATRLRGSARCAADSVLVRQTSRVLIVDDDAGVRRMLARSLVAEGYEVSVAADGGGALVEIERSAPDLILLDVTMPGIDGLGVARRVRGKGDPVPILLLTARDGVADRVTGLDAGADDYLVKPFATDELLARVRALLRRGRATGDLLSVGDVTLDLRERAASRAGRDLALTPREADLLELLLRNARRVVSRDQALEHVWGGDGSATANAVDRYVAYLRRKLGDPPLIRTVRGVGFVLDP
jgi:two-component system, OmpR family, response regulator MprA